jgi:DNA-binding response OmpR family regulator
VKLAPAKVLAERMENHTSTWLSQEAWVGVKWKWTLDEPELKIIDVFVCKLRKKLADATGGSHYIETVWGRGYVLRDPLPMAGSWPIGI